MAVSDSLTVTVNAPADQVLAFVRDLNNQHNWFPGNSESEVIETGADGNVAKARLVNEIAGVAKDEFFLNYTHGPDSMSWSLVKPTKVQKGQTGSWTIVDKGGKTEATMQLTLDASLPMPGFMQKKVLKDTLKKSTEALAKQF